LLVYPFPCSLSSCWEITNHQKSSNSQPSAI
jgi:hypothetical protein